MKKIFLLFLMMVLSSTQLGAHAVFIYAAKSKSLRAQENLASVLLPSFRYDRNNVELNQASSIELILEPSAKIVKVEVVAAEGIGLSIDDATLLKKGLQILRPKRLRSNNQNNASDIARKPHSKITKVVTFNLKKPENQPLIIKAIDFKVFKVLVKGFLPGSYTLKASVDGKEATTKVFTKSDFRLDAISPSSIERGIETTITLIGKGLDALTEVFLGTFDVEVRQTEGLDDNTLKIKAFAQENSSPGFRDVTITNPLSGNSVTLVNSLFVNGPTLEIDEFNDIQEIISNIMNGIDGMDGMDGRDGASICDDLNAMLMISSNNLPAGSQATSFFDPVLCNLTLGIPIGFNGINASGSQGAAGATGTNGTNGTNGLNCWDLNGNESCDTATEDINLSGTCTVADCQGANDIPTVQEVVSSWSTYSNEQTFTTGSGDTTRMVRIPRFIHDGVIYGGFWVDKYEASKANATSTTEGTSTVPVGQRNVVPWSNISFTTAKSNASHADRQISTLGSCKLIGSKEWTALYLLGRYSKEKSLFGATATNGWKERGNTRDGNRDGRDSSSKTCSDDPNQSGTGDRCLTGTGYKSWGHILDGSSTKNTDGTTFASSAIADDVTNSTSAFDGDKQVYDLTGNVEEWVDLTITNSSMSGGSDFVIDSGFQGAGRILPHTTDNATVNFVDLAGVNDPADKEFEGLGLPTTAAGSLTDSNGGSNGGKLRTDTTDAIYGTTRGGNYTSTSDATSPITIDFRNLTTAVGDTRGFRVICDFPSGQ